MNKRGFTLAELLGVISILAVIALIALPSVTNIISTNKIKAYNVQVNEIKDAMASYVAKQEYTIPDNAVIRLTLYQLASEGYIDMAINNPKTGTNFPMDTMLTITNTSSGFTFDVDETVGTEVYTTDQLSKIGKLSLIKDYDSQISSDYSSYISKNDNPVTTSVSKGYVIYTMTDSNGLTVNVYLNSAISSSINPKIAYTNNPSASSNGYFKSQVINVTYNVSNISNPTYYIKTTKAGSSSLSVSNSCGTATNPSNCTSITSTNNLVANTWYKVGGNVSVTYNSTTDTTGTLYALTFDGTNYSGIVTGNISQIDNTVPTVSTAASLKTITLTMADANSGVSSYCVTTSNDSSTCSWTSIANNTSATATYTASSATNYYAFSKDGVGNISAVSIVSSTALCMYDLNQVWNFDYNGGQQTFNSACNGTYKLEVWGAQGGSTIFNTGGYGAYSVGMITISQGTILYINVGGAGQTVNVANTQIAGGYNGGGAAYSADSYGTNSYGAGGGATHIAVTSGLLQTLSSNLSSVLIVAGGGGGGSYYRNTDTYYHYGSGGAGGGFNGNANYNVYSSTIGANVIPGGTQSAPTVSGTNIITGAFGQGANGVGGVYTAVYSGGGGGYYGGNSALTEGGSGGSGYIGNSSLTSKHMTCYNCATSTVASTYTNTTTNVSSTATSDYAKTGNGYAKITLISY